jgi:transcriptional regulator with PAS, ATPase and Fis domain
LFQEAHSGSIFLDEIGDISPTIQTKLLRVLQEKEIKPLGHTGSIKVDVRVIASTNRDLRAKIRKHEYREDFFYRLNVLPIHIPPLRERGEDIPLLANHLLIKHAAELNMEGKRLSPELLHLFRNHHWEGNVRELENCIIQGILYAKGDEIKPADVNMEDAPSPCISRLDELDELSYKQAKEETLTRFNQSFIGNQLAASQGNVTQAAKRCGMERQALQQIMRRYGIKADPYRDSSS